MEDGVAIMNANDIRMFAAATEIQSAWTPSLCDRVVLKNDIYTDGEDYLGRWAFAEYDNDELRDMLFWLPYQHQLQDIVQQDLVAPDYYTSTDPSGTVEYLQEFMLPEQSCPEEWFCVQCGALGTYRRQTFKSMDVTMLGMVMDVVWDKYWWDRKWYKREGGYGSQ